MIWTATARLSFWFENIFDSLGNSSDCLSKQIFRNILVNSYYFITLCILFRIALF